MSQRREDQIRFNSQYAVWQVSPDAAGKPTPLYLIVDDDGIWALSTAAPAEGRLIIIDGVPVADDSGFAAIIVHRFLVLSINGVWSLSDDGPDQARLIFSGAGSDIPAVDDSDTVGGEPLDFEVFETHEDDPGLRIYYRRTPVIIQNFLVKSDDDIFALSDIGPAEGRIIIAGGIPTADDSSTLGGEPLNAEFFEEGNAVIVP